MAEYTCPNCAGYRTHDAQCPTGGLAASARNKMYVDLVKAYDEFWINHRLHSTQLTLSDIVRVAEQVWRKQ